MESIKISVCCGTGFYRRNIEMETKNCEIYSGFYLYWLDWALPLRINAEYLSHTYTEIELQILCFNFSFTRITKQHRNELDKLLENIK